MTEKSQIVLHEFLFSNFCEKVRWAFEYKGIHPQKKDYLAFLHMRPIRQLSGQTSVPVVEFGGDVVAGSASILDRLEKESRDRSLYPANDRALEEAQNWQSQLDNVGATIRGAMFYDWMSNREFMFTMLTVGRRGMKFSAYKLFFFLMFPTMKRMLKERAPDPDSLRDQTLAMLDRVAESSQATGYLVGAEFSIADLTAAAILYPLFFPEGTPGSVLAATSDAGCKWLGRWQSHPAGEYVHRIYKDHRHIAVKRD